MFFYRYFCIYFTLHPNSCSVKKKTVKILGCQKKCREKSANFCEFVLDIRRSAGTLMGESDPEGFEIWLMASGFGVQGARRRESVRSTEKRQNAVNSKEGKMPSFSNPFEGMQSDRKMTNKEIVRALRFMVSAEYEAVQLYMQMADSIENTMLQKALREIANDERVHAGCFLRLLMAVDPEEESYYETGAKEMEEKFIRKASAKDMRIVKDKESDGE